jgi:HlyD family secretion protein
MASSRHAVLIILTLWGCKEGAAVSVGGTGVVEGTVVDVASKVGGRLITLPVKEGQAVQRDAVLLGLDCEEPRHRLAEAEAQLEAARAEVEAALAMAEAEEVQGSAASSQANASAARTRALSAQQDVAVRDKNRLVAVGKYAAESQLDRATVQAEGLDLEVQAAKAQAQAATQTARAAKVRASSAGARAAAVSARLRALEQVVSLAKIMVAECELRAPRAAVVEDILYDVGELVPPGAPAVRLIDLSDVWVTFYLDNASLGQLTVGETAEVIADAWPAETFVGTISTVGAQAEFTPRNIQTKDDRTRLVYPIDVRLENPKARLRPGMPVTARVLGSSQP